MSWVATGVAVGGAGLGMSVYGSIQGASAAKNAAQAQQDQAAAWQRFNTGQRNEALDKINNPSDLAAYDQALTAQKSNVQRMQTLAQSLDPNLADIGKQLHGLLNGQSAPVLDNMKQQRSLQRQQLMDRMNQQLGPGGASSSAGIQALNQFDNDTSNQLSQAQNQHLQQFMGASLQSPNVINALGGANGQLSDLIASGPNARSAQMIANFAGVNNASQNAMYSSAGGQFKGDQLMAQGMQQLGGSLIQAVGSAAGGKYMKGQGDSALGSAISATGNVASAQINADAQKNQLTMPTMGSSFGAPAPNYSLGANYGGGRMATGNPNSGPVPGGSSGYGPMAGGYQYATPSQGTPAFLGGGSQVNYAGNLYGNSSGNQASGY